MKHIELYERFDDDQYDEAGYNYKPGRVAGTYNLYQKDRFIKRIGVDEFTKLAKELKTVGPLTQKVFKDPTGENLYNLFDQINKDEKKAGGRVVILSDEKFYTEQIKNLYEYFDKDISSERAKELARRLADHVKNK